MGEVRENLLTKGFSGKIGDEIVFRQVGNRTLFAKRPRKRTSVNQAQQQQQDTFSKAVEFAKSMLLDPVIRADYETRAKLAELKSAYVAALTDYLRMPKMNSVSTDYYKGAVGDVIWIIALDDFKIQSLTVTLSRADNSLIETGEAVLEHGRWKYLTTQANAAIAGTKITVVAKDRPGKEATIEKTL